MIMRINDHYDLVLTVQNSLYLKTWKSHPIFFKVLILRFGARLVIILITSVKTQVSGNTSQKLVPYYKIMWDARVCVCLWVCVVSTPVLCSKVG